MKEPKYTIVLFYKYTPITYPKREMKWQKNACEDLRLTGRTIIAKEGINSTLEGTDENINRYIALLSKREGFENIHWKLSNGTGDAFPKLSIKIRDEIVSTHLGKDDIDPNIITGKYLTAEQLHEWIHEEKKELYIVDMRNDYEFKAGYFKNSILADFRNFRDLPKITSQLKELRDKTIVTVCTGGIRCEKASGFLVKNGFKNVYQLQGGIVSYMEKYPNEDFLGKLYVFDNRILMGFNTADPRHTVVGKCDICGKSSENFINCAIKHCNKHFISCTDCYILNAPYCINCRYLFWPQEGSDATHR